MAGAWRRGRWGGKGGDADGLERGGWREMWEGGGGDQRRQGRRGKRKKGEGRSDKEIECQSQTYARLLKVELFQGAV